jgi:TetR/AcrR family transcriptional regulator
MTGNPEEHTGSREILRAATELFAERGFDAVPISAIAERAGSSKANVFHHFGSKSGLYFAVMRGATTQLTDEFSRLLDSDLDPEVKLERAIQASLATLFEDECRTRLVFREVIEAGPERAVELAKDVFGREFTTLRALFADIQRHTDDDSGIDPSFLAYLLVSFNVMLLHCRHVIRHLPYGAFVNDREHYLEMLRDLLLRGIDRRRDGDKA